jgi:hypothetical protein
VESKEIKKERERKRVNEREKERERDRVRVMQLPHKLVKWEKVSL